MKPLTPSPVDPLVPPDQRAPFRRALLAWYEKRRRSLPWRDDPTPYRVWVSEIMLQQTTVRAVIPFYERFVAAFPDVETLAAAPLDAVLALWSGLGYYSRARNLHRAAEEIVSRHGGRFPAEIDAALALPGIGPYTAAAILSIAHGRALAVVDGNVIRVAARLGRLPGHAKSTGLMRAARQMSAELLDPRAPGAFNQAMMELGATVCTPRAPGCDRCPVAYACAARMAGVVDALPEPPPRVVPVAEVRALFVVRKEAMILLRRRDAGTGLMAGLWELPDLAIGPEETGLRLPLGRLGSELSSLLGVEVRPVARLGQIRHSIMNRRIRLEIITAETTPRFRPPPPWRWHRTEAIAELGTSSIVTKVLRLMGECADVTTA